MRKHYMLVMMVLFCVYSILFAGEPEEYADQNDIESALALNEGATIEEYSEEVEEVSEDDLANDQQLQENANDETTDEREVEEVYDDQNGVEGGDSGDTEVVESNEEYEASSDSDIEEIESDAYKVEEGEQEVSEEVDSLVSEDDANSDIKGGDKARELYAQAEKEVEQIQNYLEVIQKKR